MNTDTSTLRLGPGAPATASGTAPSSRRWRRLGLAAATELAVIGTLYIFYRIARLAIDGREPSALANSDVIRRLEAALHLPSEAWLQDVFGQVPHLFEAANSYYVYVHFPVTIAFLLWGFIGRPRAEYLWARNLMVIQTLLGLVLHFFIPLAPPRMFPEWGFTDTMTRYGPSAYEGASAAVANQYAAMPSLHIGWAVLIAVVVSRTASRRWGAVAWTHAMVTIAVVVVTANHWWLDGAVAVALLGIAMLILTPPDRSSRRLNASLTRRTRDQPVEPDVLTTTRWRVG